MSIKYMPAEMGAQNCFEKAMIYSVVTRKHGLRNDVWSVVIFINTIFSNRYKKTCNLEIRAHNGHAALPGICYTMRRR